MVLVRELSGPGMPVVVLCYLSLRRKGFLYLCQKRKTKKHPRGKHMLLNTTSLPKYLDFLIGRQILKNL
jgi:hypothetical protein